MDRPYQDRRIDTRWMRLFWKRLAQLEHCADAYEEDDSVGDFLSLRATVSDYFSPLIQLMIDTGMLYVSVDGDGEKFTGMVAGNVEIVLARDLKEGGDLCLHVPVINDTSDKPICEEEPDE